MSTHWQSKRNAECYALCTMPNVMQASPAWTYSSTAGGAMHLYRCLSSTDNLHQNLSSQPLHHIHTHMKHIHTNINKHMLATTVYVMYEVPFTEVGRMICIGISLQRLLHRAPGWRVNLFLQNQNISDNHSRGFGRICFFSHFIFH